MKSRFSFPWDTASEAMLKEMWEGGYSGGACANVLSREFRHPVTRSAIMGKVHRRGFMQPFGTNNKSTKARPRKHNNGRTGTKAVQKLTRIVLGGTTFKAVPPKITAPVVVSVDAEPVSRNITLFQLNGHTCRWPYGDGKYTFCGAEPEMQSPYCAAHTSMAYHGKRT